MEARPTRKRLVLLPTLRLHLLFPFALEQFKGRLAAPQPPSGPHSPTQDLAPHKGKSVELRSGDRPSNILVPEKVYVGDLGSGLHPRGCLTLNPST